MFFWQRGSWYSFQRFGADGVDFAFVASNLFVLHVEDEGVEMSWDYFKVLTLKKNMF